MAAGLVAGCAKLRTMIDSGMRPFRLFLVPPLVAVPGCLFLAACGQDGGNRDEALTSAKSGGSASEGTGGADGGVTSTRGSRAEAGAMVGGTGGTNAGAPVVRPALESILPNYFGFGYSSFSKTRSWPPTVEASDGIDWTYLYWYHLMEADDTVLPARMAEARERGVVPVLTHYQLLDRAKGNGHTGAQEWDVVIAGVEDPDVMGPYFDNVESIMKAAAAEGSPLIFQTEPDSTTWLRQYHTGDTWDANNGVVAVASTGHPDLAELPNTIAGYAQALVRLRDLYAPMNVYMGLCEFDNENGWNPERSVAFVQSLGVQFDVLFTHHAVKYSTKDDGWWDAYSETDQARFLTWISTITQATGLRYLHWQTVIGASDYGLMPNYPTAERISDLVAAGSIGALFDLYSLDGPPHSQPWHGFSTSPPPDHPAYNSLERLSERLSAYYAAPIPLR